MAGGYVSTYIDLNEEQSIKTGGFYEKQYRETDYKANGHIVLLVDNTLTHSGKKMICGTEVHYGPIRTRRDLDRYKGLPITDYNIVGWCRYEKEVKQLVRPRREA